MLLRGDKWGRRLSCGPLGRTFLPLTSLTFPVLCRDRAAAAAPCTAGTLAEALGVWAAKVKKLLEEHKIKPDDVKGACK
jgi:hypothetical protein